MRFCSVTFSWNFEKFSGKSHGIIMEIKLEFGWPPCGKGKLYKNSIQFFGSLAFAEGIL